MKMKGSVIIVLWLLLGAVGCTQNDGHIGDWFGMWQVERIDIDGEKSGDYAGNVILKFQGSVMESCVLQPYHEQVSYFANCRIEPDALIVDAGSHPVWPAGYAPELHIPQAGEMRLEIVMHGNGRAVLRRENSGTTYEYYLKKLYD